MQLSTELKTHKIIFKFDPERTKKHILVSKEHAGIAKKAQETFFTKKMNGSITIDQITFLAADIRGIEPIDLTESIKVSEQKKEIALHKMPASRDQQTIAASYGINLEYIKSLPTNEKCENPHMADKNCKCSICESRKYRGYKGRSVYCDKCGHWSPFTISTTGETFDKNGEEWQKIENDTICLYCS